MFAAKLPDGNTGLSEGGDQQGRLLLALSRAPGTIPSHVNPPKPKLTAEESWSRRPRRRHRPPRCRRHANAAATRTQRSEGWFSSLARKVGIGGSETTAGAPPPAAATEAKVGEQTLTAVGRAFPRRPSMSSQRSRLRPKPAAPAFKPSVADTPASVAAAAPLRPPKEATIARRPAVPIELVRQPIGAMKLSSPDFRARQK